MLGGGFKSSKLQVNLKLAMNRFKLLEKKKTEQAMKARREIADLIKNGRVERARIKVEHIIREDYLVEAMEILELYCDLLVARMGLLETMAYCEEGLAESVTTLIWAAPRLQQDIQELDQISKQLVLKFGKTFGEQARANRTNTVNEKVIHRLGVGAPSSVLVERYLVEIAKNYNIHYQPDPTVMLESGIPAPLDEKLLLDSALNNNNNNNNNNFSGPPGYPPNFPPGNGPSGGMPSAPIIQMPMVPQMPMPMPQLPSIPSEEFNAYPSNLAYNPPAYPDTNSIAKPPLNSEEFSLIGDEIPRHHETTPSAPDFVLPSVPGNNNRDDDDDDGGDIDLDDLAKRFEELKKKK